MGMTAEERARRVRVLLFDVDGVLTRGEITVMPNADGTATEVKSFSAHDGMGIAVGRMAGLKVGWVTKRRSRAVEVRAKDLKVDHVYQGQHNKREALEAVMREEGCSAEEVCFVGDDIIDLPAMRLVGFAVAVGNARRQAKEAAHWVAPSNGGEGAGRDVIEFILTAKGVLEKTIEDYLTPGSEAARQADIGVGNM